MAKSFAPEVQRHVDNFSQQLSKLQRLRVTTEFFSKPENARQIAYIFLQYRLLIKSLLKLSEDDRQIIEAVNAGFQKGGVEFLDAIGEYKESLIALLDEVLSPNSEKYGQALSELESMMQNGQEIFEAGETPQDGDPKSDAAIWGFTQIDPSKVETQLHFVTCHFIERLLTQTLKEAGVEMAQHKDYFLTAITDALILQNIKYKRFAEIYEVWLKPRKEGGLGWLSDRRLGAYSQLLLDTNQKTEE